VPGLVGFIKPDSSVDGARAFLAQMARALEVDDRYEVALHHEAGVGLGRVGLSFLGSEGEVVWNQDQTRCLVMEGELYDTAALRQSVSEEGRQCEVCGQAELVLCLYERFGEDFVTRLNGAFVAAIWDRSARRLLLVNDRLGLFPLYYARVNRDLLFASGVRGLLADAELNRTVDLVAMNEFLVYDHALDDRTLLTSVRRLPQGSILAFCEGQLTIRRYWTLRYPDVYEPQAESAYVEQFEHYLRQAVTRQQPGDRPAGVLLSGGLDSRLLLGALCELGAKIHTLTFGIPGCDDARFAAEVAATLGTQHHFLELKPDWLLDFAEEAVRLTDGLGNIVNLHVMATRETQCRYAQVLYKGVMGGNLLGFALKRQMWADYEPKTRHEVHLEVHASKGLVNYDRLEQRRLFADTFQAQVGDAAFQAYREAMDAAGVSQLANQQLYFDLTQRVPRMALNGVEVARSRAVVRLPYADNDLLDSVLRTPPGYLFERYLPKAALAKYFHRLAKIPLAETGRPLSFCARDVLVQVKSLLSWHLRRFGLGWLAAPERRPYKDYHGWFRTVLRPWVEGTLLQRRALDRGYFNPAFIRQLVAEHVGGANHGVRLGALLTLELWHRQFLD